MAHPRFWLCVPPVAFALLDQTVTLIGQGAEYWKGHYEAATEGNSLYLWFLQQHPLAFEAGVVAWIVLFCLVINYAPRRIAMTISIAIVLGHSWGTSTWLIFYVPYGYWITMGVYLAAGIAVTTTWDRFAAASGDGRGA